MRVMLCVSLVAVSSNECYAADKKTSSKSKGKKKNAKGKDPKNQAAESGEGKTDTSAASKIEVLGNAGLSPSPLLGFGATVGMINGGGSGIESTLTYASGSSGTISASVFHLGGRYRMGIAKIGYIAAGAGFRMASGKWFVINADESAEYAAGSSLNAVTIDASVGGQIKFGSFVLGADLLGISLPIFKLGVKKTLPSESGYSEDDANSQQAKFDKIAAGMNLTLVKAGVGIMF